MHKLETTTGSFLGLTSGSLSGKIRVNFCKSWYIQLKFIFNWSQYIKFCLNLRKALCASLCNSVDITCGLVKENSSSKKKSPL